MYLEVANFIQSYEFELDFSSSYDKTSSVNVIKLKKWEDELSHITSNFKTKTTIPHAQNHIQYIQQISS